MNSLDHKRHSLAHILAQAVVQMFPEAKLGIGPAIDNGFYYDFDLPRTLIPEDLPILEEKMRKIIEENQQFVRKEEPVDQAIEYLFTIDQPYKVELAKDFKAQGSDIVSFYSNGHFHDLCRGGHVDSTGEIDPKAFKLVSIAGAYWKGSEKNKMLQRIYGWAFENEKALNEYAQMMEEAKKRDHKKIGVDLDLFVFSDLVGSGLPMWTPRGTLLRSKLDEMVWKLRSKKGYERVEIPHITKKDLYERSGHWEKYKDDLFQVETREKHEFAMKPMNCPHHTQIYQRKQWSYRNLPQRYANTTMCYRDEQSGELSGLTRVRSFTQDDAHVFCRMVQAKEEFLKIWDIVHEFYGAFGFKLRVRLSLHDPEHPEKYLGDAERWRYAENMLREIAREKEADAFDGIGEAAFYGPKLDFMARDSIGREHQVATIQLDMNMPERFDLYCVNETGEQERIVMIHAAIMGSIERFMAVYIEHVAGVFPFWLAPTQVRVLPVSEKFNDYAKKIEDMLKEHDVRVEVDRDNDTLGKKIRNAEMMKIPHIVVVGEKEMESDSVTLRYYGKKEQKNYALADYVKEAKEEGRLPV